MTETKPARNPQTDEIPQRLIDKAFRIHDKIDGLRDEATYIAVIAQALDEERRDWFECMSALSSFFGVGLGEDYHTAQQMYDRVMWGVNFRDERTVTIMDKYRSALKLVVEHDDLLKTFEGPAEDTLFSGDVPKIDFAYDVMVGTARAALGSPVEV